MNLIEDDRWFSHCVTGAFFEEKATWLCQKRNLHSSSHRFFEESGSLISLSRYRYPLASVAFFHAIPGLERALKIHFKDETSSLSELLLRALETKLICDSLFKHRKAFTQFFSETVKSLVEEQYDNHSELITRLIPKLRNQYFHGTYHLAPDYLHLTFQLREIADALTTRHSR